MKEKQGQMEEKRSLNAKKLPLSRRVICLETGMLLNFRAGLEIKDTYVASPDIAFEFQGQMGKWVMS
jgi:hypothetical protein